MGRSVGARVEPVEQMDRQGGLYLAVSHSSLHVFDLDAAAYMRLPGERSNSFPHDEAVLRLTQVERWPQVRGDPFFIWLDDPREYALMEYWRQSSEISAMYRVLSAAEEAPPKAADTSRAGEEMAAEEGAPDVSAAASAVDGMGTLAGPRRPRMLRPEPGSELVAGLKLCLDGVWMVLTSPSEPLVDPSGIELVRPAVLEWPVRLDQGWETLLSIYRLAVGDGMRLRLDVRHGGSGGPRSTSAVRGVRLVHHQPADTRLRGPGSVGDGDVRG